jgi:hypothetical protein
MNTTAYLNTLTAGGVTWTAADGEPIQLDWEEGAAELIPVASGDDKYARAFIPVGLYCRFTIHARKLANKFTADGNPTSMSATISALGNTVPLAFANAVYKNTTASQVYKQPGMAAYNFECFATDGQTNPRTA